MTTPGINCDPRHGMLARDVADLFANNPHSPKGIVRFPLIWSWRRRYPAWIRRCWGQDLLPLPVFGGNDAFPRRLLVIHEDGSIDRIVDKRLFLSWLPFLKGVTMLQAGNQSDVDAADSWTMTPAEFSHLLDVAAQVFPPDSGVTVITGALVRGDPTYLDEVLQS